MKKRICIIISLFVLGFYLKGQDTLSVKEELKYKEISLLGGTQPIDGGVCFSLNYSWGNKGKFINHSLGFDASLYDYIELKQVGYKGFQARLYNANFMLTHRLGDKNFQINIGVGGFIGAGTVRLETTRLGYYHYNEEYVAGGKGFCDIAYVFNEKMSGILRNTVFTAFTFSGDSYILYNIQLGLTYKF